MEILSHRGYWRRPEEKNDPVAFDRSFYMGFGTETDVRDHEGKLVIAHDAPSATALPFGHYLKSLATEARRPLLQALNVKADGLADVIAQEMKDVPHPWFVFDMSIPDTLAHLRVGNPVYARMSEFEPFPDRLRGEIRGIWLDAFQGTWYSTDTIKGLLDQGLGVCIVSPELHGRVDYADLWSALRPFNGHPLLSLCTDHPERAADTFGPPIHTC